MRIRWQLPSRKPFGGYVYNGMEHQGDGATGDVVGVVGIGHNGTQLEGFYSISRCTAA